MTSPSRSTRRATASTSWSAAAAEPGPKASMSESACTPGQTIGPFFGLGLPYPGDSDLAGDGHPQAVRLCGTVYDGAGAGVPDALVELWQPDTAGRIPRRAGS